MLKKITGVLFLGLIASCQTFSFLTNTTKKTDDEAALQLKHQKLVVSPFWVTSTLDKPNYGFRKINRFSPVLYKDLIISANALEGLVAYDLFDKSVKWKFKTSHGIEASGAVINQLLFIGDQSGQFYSINLDTGALNWSFKTNSEILAEPLLVEGLVYFITGANAIYCLDATTGRQIWVYNRQETDIQMTIRGGGKPAYSAGVIYQGFSDGAVVALNSKTGTQQWEVTLNRNTKFKDIDASPILDQDKLYINSYDDRLYAISKATGSILWTSEFGGATSPLIAGDYLIYTSSKDHLIAVDKKNGSLKWKVKNLNGIGTEPILHKGLVAIGESQGSIVFFDLLSGEKKGSFDPGRGVLGRLTSDKIKRIYFMSGEANLYGVEVEYKNTAINFPFIVQ